MREVLEAVFGPLDAMLAAIPLAAARWAAVALLLAATALPWLLDRESLWNGVEHRSVWRDLRWWSLIAMIPYVLLYALL